MRTILYDFQMVPTTWVYLSSLIMIAIYFKFRRFWSVRNFDLLGLIAFAPGLLLVVHGIGQISRLDHLSLAHRPPDFEALRAAANWLVQMGYIWLFSVGGLFLIRLLLDPLMVRRPLLEPNLSASGLVFAGVALWIFLMSNFVTMKPTESDLEGGQRMDQALARQATPAVHKRPGLQLFQTFSSFSNKPLDVKQVPADEYQRSLLRAIVTRTVAILAHLAIVIGMVLIGYRHFDNIHTGVAVAALYLLLPYTAGVTPWLDFKETWAEYENTVIHVIPPWLDHTIPAALLVWAIEAYRRPVVSGLLLGLAAGLVYYPFFLLPLWCSFYWRRGLVRFGIGFALAMLLLLGVLALTSASLADFWQQFLKMFGLQILHQKDLKGFWEYNHPVLPMFRIPVAAAFMALCGSLALWPAQKNLGTLLSCSATVMLGIQFWQGQQGGLYMAWYLPLLVLTIFRPNLEDRVAVSAVSESWMRWRWNPEGRKAKKEKQAELQGEKAKA